MLHLSSTLSETIIIKYYYIIFRYLILDAIKAPSYMFEKVMNTSLSSH